MMVGPIPGSANGANGQAAAAAIGMKPRPGLAGGPVGE